MKPAWPRKLTRLPQRLPEAGSMPVERVAHGLNNALAVINGFSELLLGVMTECDPHRRYVEEIERAGQHAAELTRQLLSGAGRAAAPPAGKARANRALRDLAHDHRGHETILLVDDDDAVRDSLGHALAVLGYNVLAAEDGLEALRVAAGMPNRRIDLLLTDVVMPGMNGRDLARRLLQIRPSIRVVYTSGYTDGDAAFLGLAETGSSFLPKPFLPEALAGVVRSQLNRLVPVAGGTGAKDDGIGC